MTTISVGSNSTRRPTESPATKEGGQPDHWQDKAGSGFVNPWPSWRATKPWEMFGLMATMLTQAPSPQRDAALQDKLPIRTPTWGLEKNDDASESRTEKAIKTTWLGHACFLVEFPSREKSKDARGVRLLFDPVFSDRCSPFTFAGPKRFTPPPCKIEEIPEIDAIVISHNHYDHMDTHTLQTLYRRAPERPPQIFAPLGNGPYLRSIGVPESSTHIMDWWDSKKLTLSVPSPSSSNAEGASKPQVLSVDVTCTPCQHFTGRSLTDRFKTLWSSWAIEEVLPGTESGLTPLKLFFGGDTGYRAVMNGQNEDDVPVCPAFKEIGEAFGGFDVALIPIGAYMPRQFMSPIHCAPQDSVRLFKDIKAKKGLGMHWATWVLTTEDVLEPPKRLAEECKKIGIPEGDFTVCDIGETLFYF